MRLLAQIGMKLEIFDDAEFLLESVLVFAPDYHLARYDYARVLSYRHLHAKALEQSHKLLEIEPGTEPIGPSRRPHAAVSETTRQRSRSIAS